MQNLVFNVLFRSARSVPARSLPPSTARTSTWTFARMGDFAHSGSFIAPGNKSTRPRHTPGNPPPPTDPPKGQKRRTVPMSKGKRTSRSKAKAQAEAESLRILEMYLDAHTPLDNGTTWNMNTNSPQETRGNG